MSKPIVFLNAAIALLLIAGCQNKSASNEQSEITNQKNADSTALPISKDTTTSGFRKTLTLQNISFDINTLGDGSVQQLFIRTNGLKDSVASFELEIDGKVTDCETEDLNKDGYPELLIYTQSAGSGSYGDVIAYSVTDGKSMNRISFPPVAENEKVNDGYMGHDEFALVETTLMQKFPIYKTGDINSNPTGGIRQIEYQLKAEKANLKFVIKRVVNHP